MGKRRFLQFFYIFMMIFLKGCFIIDIGEEGNKDLTRKDGV